MNKRELVIKTEDTEYGLVKKLLGKQIYKRYLYNI